MTVSREKRYAASTGRWVRVGGSAAFLVAVLMVRPAWAGGEHEAGLGSRFGVLHPSLVHFPIALATAAAFGELAGLIFKVDILRKFALVAILLAGIAVVPVYLTGHAAHGLRGRMAAALAARVERHDAWGTATMWVVLASAVMALAARLRAEWWPLRIAALAALVLAAALAGFTGFLGAEVVRGPDHLAPLFETGALAVPAHSGAQEPVLRLTMISPAGEIPVRAGPIR